MKQLVLLRQNWRWALLVVVGLFCLYSTIIYLTVGQRGYDDVLVKLAFQFLHWKIQLSPFGLPARDAADYYSNYYVYFGPLSSLLLLPFVFLFGLNTPQVLIGVFSLIASGISVYFISQKFKFSTVDSLWLSIFFVFSTVLFTSGVIDITAWQVEALGVPFILLALWAYFAKRNGFIIGVFIALAVMTRFTLFLSAAFFFFEILQKRFTVRQLALLLIPIVIAFLILGFYNQRRFHSFFETGYSYSTTKADNPIGHNFVYGDKSPIHIPANLYSFFVMGPDPLLLDYKGGMVLKFPYLKANAWGMAIWFTSPLFLLLVLKFKKGIYTYSAALTALLLSVPVFLWYSIGYAQFGYRYALDFLPFLFILLLHSLSPKLSKTAIILIILGVLFNCIYAESMWEIYPLFNIYH